MLYRYSILILLTLSAIKPLFAGEMVDLSLKVPDSGLLLIDNTRGVVTVTGWDKTEVLLQGELDDSARELIFKTKGHKTLIKVVMDGMSHHGDNSVLKVFMPKNLKLRFKGVDTSFNLSNLTNRVEGQTINGDLKLDNIHSKMKVSSVSGHIDVSNSSGRAQIESVSGEVVLSGQFSKAKVNSMTGKVMANIDHIKVLKIENVSGNTVINGSLQNKAYVKLTSVSGNIHYKSKGQLNAACNIASQFGGKIINFLTEDRPWSERMEEQKLHFVSGDGSGKLVMNTVSGSVTLDK
ncbi:MAG: hypothetical protein ACI9FJ_001762 [Alteromonadaceae bacterium]|jgi:hypothetical protein